MSRLPSWNMTWSNSYPLNAIGSKWQDKVLDLVLKFSNSHQDPQTSSSSSNSRKIQISTVLSSYSSMLSMVSISSTSSQTQSILSKLNLRLYSRLLIPQLDKQSLFRMEQHQQVLGSMLLSRQMNRKNCQFSKRSAFSWQFAGQILNIQTWSTWLVNLLSKVFYTRSSLNHYQITWWLILLQALSMSLEMRLSYLMHRIPILQICLKASRINN